MVRYLVSFVNLTWKWVKKLCFVTYLHIESPAYLTIISAAGHLFAAPSIEVNLIAGAVLKTKILWWQDAAAHRMWRFATYWPIIHWITQATLAKYWRWRCKIFWNPTIAKWGYIAYAGASASTTFCFTLLLYACWPVPASYRITDENIVAYDIDISYPPMLYSTGTTNIDKCFVWISLKSCFSWWYSNVVLLPVQIVDCKIIVSYINLHV